MRIHFILPGLHRVHRGAEVAFESIANEIAKMGLDDVTVAGSGQPLPDRFYRFRHASLISREKFLRAPSVPPFRTEFIWEEASWTFNYLRQYRPRETDVTVTCSYPFVNWMLTRWPPFARRPAHVFVTQNGDWPAYSEHSEYRFFRCDGLVCTNPDYFERNKNRYRSKLIPNGIDPARFCPGHDKRAQFGLPPDAPIILMVSALMESKRVLEGLRAVARIPNAFLVVAGDGPLLTQFNSLGEELMPGRFRRVTLPSEQMPDLYRSADVVLHPTFHESFGNVYVEAMSTGIPVIAHDYSVTRWIFGADYPGLVDAGNTEALAEAINRALNAGKSKAFSRAAQEAERRFSWASIAREYRDFFLTLVEPAK